MSIYAQTINGRCCNYVPDPMPPEWHLEVCRCSNWKCWMCAGSGMRWQKGWSPYDSCPPTFKQWHAMTDTEKERASLALWELVDGWWEVRSNRSAMYR